jgi:hypothetical protein
MAANATSSKPTPKPQRPLTEYKKDISYGVWYSLHVLAAWADLNRQPHIYEDQFRFICKSMTGCDCNGHCIQMLDRDPVSNYRNMKNKDGKFIGCLYHSYLRHNEVNVRLGKAEMAYEDVEPLYLPKDEIKPCTAPANIDELANKFPGLILRSDESSKSTQSDQRGQTNGLVNRRFQLVKAT